MVEVIVMVYNERMLLPFFLDHYRWADKIHVIIDEDTTDNSEEICKEYENVVTSHYKFPDMLNASLLSEAVNNVATICKDWIIAVDCDEFIFHKEHKNVKKFLEEQATKKKMVADFYEVFRHRSEADLDYSKPALFQRRHGNPKLGVSYGIQLYHKPIIAKRELNPTWTAGKHRLRVDGRYAIAQSKERLLGAHWSMADPDVAVYRRIKNMKERMSDHDTSLGMGKQHFNITEEEIRKECERWLDAPQLF